MDGGRIVALLLGCLFDLSPEGAPVPLPEKQWTPDPEPSFAQVGLDAARSLVMKPLRALQAVTDLGLTIHAHPTLSETVGFAAEVAEGTATDLPPKRKRPQKR